MSSAPRPPTRFGYKVAVICACAFGGVAAWPYIATAAERLAQGKEVSSAEVKKDVAKAEKEKERKDGKFEPKAVLVGSDGGLLIGGKHGLSEWRNGTLTSIGGFPGHEVRGLATGKDGAVIAAAKDGLWQRNGSEWRQIQNGDFHGITIGTDGVVYASSKAGVVRSTDGAKWEVLPGTETGWKPEEKHDKEEKGDKPYKAEKEKKE
jgi:hypothetical protein